MLLTLLKEWNRLLFSKPLIGRTNKSEIEFYLDTLYKESSQLYEKLSQYLKDSETPGQLVHLGHCMETHFHDLSEGTLRVESSRFKKYKLYFFVSEPTPEEFDKRIKELIKIIQEINK